MSESIDPKARKMIARAWKDEEFREGLPQEVREKLPPRPEGASEMSDEQLEAAAGGTTAGCAAAGVAVGSLIGGYGISELID